MADFVCYLKDKSVYDKWVEVENVSIELHPTTCIHLGAGKLGRSKVGLGKLGPGKLGFGKVGR